MAKHIQKEAGAFAKNELMDKKGETIDITNAEETARILRDLKGSERGDNV